MLVFKIKDLANKRHLYKIDMNAQQFHLTGCCITCPGQERVWKGLRKSAPGGRNNGNADQNRLHVSGFPFNSSSAFDVSNDDVCYVCCPLSLRLSSLCSSRLRFVFVMLTRSFYRSWLPLPCFSLPCVPTMCSFWITLIGSQNRFNIPCLCCSSFLSAFGSSYGFPCSCVCCSCLCI